jgi:hypothetical protein
VLVFVGLAEGGLGDFFLFVVVQGTGFGAFAVIRNVCFGCGPRSAWWAISGKRNEIYRRKRGE